MDLPNSCKELWLEGITDVYLYPTLGAVLPMPYCVAQILNMQQCQFPAHALHISISTDNEVTATAITAKLTPNDAPSGTVYAYEITANIETGSDVLRTLYNNIAEKDHLAVLKLADDTLRLCYTMPGTFAVKMPLSVNDIQQRSVTVSLKSLSEFIPITLKGETVL